MGKTFCIYPKDSTTAFLEPVFNAICGGQDVGSVTGDSSDDEFFDSLNKGLQDVSLENLIFLGHGSSAKLYGTRFDTLLEDKDFSLLTNKTIILFSCNSRDFLKKMGATRYIGFGFVPSGLDDINDGTNFHGLNLLQLTGRDWEYVRCKYRKIWVDSLRGFSDFNNVEGLGSRLNLYMNCAIVDVLEDKTFPNRSLIADMLYYIKEDMVVY